MEKVGGERGSGRRGEVCDLAQEACPPPLAAHAGLVPFGHWLACHGHPQTATPTTTKWGVHPTHPQPTLPSPDCYTFFHPQTAAPTMTCWSGTCPPIPLHTPHRLHTPRPTPRPTPHISRLLQRPNHTLLADCYTHDDLLERYVAMRDALNATGRPMLYCLCEWVSPPLGW